MTPCAILRHSLPFILVPTGPLLPLYKPVHVAYSSLPSLIKRYQIPLKETHLTKHYPFSYAPESPSRTAGSQAQITCPTPTAFGNTNATHVQSEVPATHYSSIQVPPHGDIDDFFTYDEAGPGKLHLVIRQEEITNDDGTLQPAIRTVDSGTRAYSQDGKPIEVDHKHLHMISDVEAGYVAWADEEGTPTGHLFKWGLENASPLGRQRGLKEEGIVTMAATEA